MRWRDVVVVGIGLAGLLGCSEAGRTPDAKPRAVLTPVGQPEVLLGSGWEHALEVRYEDRDGQPLAGAIEFRLSGDMAGASLAYDVVRPNAQGIARTTLRVGERDAELEVIADAPDADPVSWTIEVSASTPPLGLTGEYVVESQLEPLSSLPREVERAVGVFDDMGAGELAPATWLLDTIADNVEYEALSEAVEQVRPELDHAVYHAIRETSPQLHDELAEIADYLDEAARQFGTTTVLQIGSQLEGIERTGPVAAHTLTGMSFRVGGGEYHFATGFGTESVRSREVRVSAQRLDEMEVGDHELPLRYGRMLVAALEQVILPRVASPHVTDLDTFFRRNIDCERVGELVSERVMEGSPKLFETLCEQSAEMVADVVMAELLSLDDEDGVYLVVRGKGVPHDFDGDRIVDRIDGGWRGLIRYEGRSSQLDSGASAFRADRIDVR